MEEPPTPRPTPALAPSREFSVLAPPIPGLWFKAQLPQLKLLIHAPAAALSKGLERLRLSLWVSLEWRQVRWTRP